MRSPGWRPAGAPRPSPSLLLVQQQRQQTAGERHQQQAEDRADGLAPLRESPVLLRVVSSAVAVEAHPGRKPRHSGSLLPRQRPQQPPAWGMAPACANVTR